MKDLSALDFVKFLNITWPLTQLKYVFLCVWHAIAIAQFFPSKNKIKYFKYLKLLIEI